MNRVKTRYWAETSTWLKPGTGLKRNLAEAG